MCRFAKQAVVVLVAGVVLAPPSFAQTTRGSAASPLVLVQVRADATGVFAHDRVSAQAIGPERPVEFKLAPGRYTFRATSGNQNDYWEHVVLIAPPGPMSVIIDFAGAANRRRAEEARLGDVREQTLDNARKAEAAREQAGVVRRRTDEARRTAGEQSREAMRKLEATITAIGALERRFQAYTEAAEKLQADAGNLKAQASAQNTSSVLGALAGLVGNIGASSLLKDSWRNQMRARGALRRMNRLTAVLSDASDNGFDRLPASGDAPAVFAIERKGARGELTVANDRIEYRESPLTSGKPASNPVTMSATCVEVRTVKTKGKALNIKFQKQDATFNPIGIGAEDLLAEIFIACPERDF